MDSKLSLWDPSRSLADNFFKSFWDGTSIMPSTMRTSINMYEQGDNIIVELSVPGFKKDNFDINIENNVLTVSAQSEITEEDDDKDKNYYYKEVQKASFSRSVQLPIRVNAENTSATYTDGILKVELPKAEEAKPKKISIKAS